jgi:hypothetical protein
VTNIFKNLDLILRFFQVKTKVAGYVLWDNVEPRRSLSIPAELPPNSKIKFSIFEAKNKKQDIKYTLFTLQLWIVYSRHKITSGKNKLSS